VDKLPYLVAVIKGHIDNDFINDFINFPPIIKKIEVTTDTNTISKYMYEHMVSNKLSTDKKEKKLTQLLSTHDQFMSFGMYELWFLNDECHFIIDGIDNLITFTKHDKFSGFVNHFFNDRVKAKKEGNTGRSILDKIVLNGSYGSDGQNNEKFTTIKFLNRDKTIKAHANYNFKATHKVTDDLFIVEKEPTSASCKKPLQSAFATLSNAKFWYLTFVYKFMNRCLDQSRFHFIYTDTDSYMFAVAGDPARGLEQNFDAIVTDREFYDKNYDLFFPKQKTLLTLEYEHCGYDMIALAPKNYYITDRIEETVKQKGVTIDGTRNTHLNKEAFEDCANNGVIAIAENNVLRTKNNHMTKQILRKTGISGVNTKSVVLENGCCCPFIHGLTSDNYHVKE
jgi:hypothetical protein